MKKLIFITLLFISSDLFSLTEINSFVNSAFSVVDINQKPNPLLNIFFKKQNKRKKIIATALAFPIPGGLIGAHRIYLGTKPYVPVVYIVTIGGFLIVPLVDFCILLCNKDITRFENNPHVLMWIDNEKKSPVKEDVKTESK